MIALDIFGITNNGLLAITALLTGFALVALAMWIAKLISPRSFNPQKAKPMNVVSRHAVRACRNLKSDTICLQFSF